MARNTSITLGDHFGSFVDERVAAGCYGSASEVVRATPASTKNPYWGDHAFHAMCQQCIEQFAEEITTDAEQGRCSECL